MNIPRRSFLLAGAALLAPSGASAEEGKAQEDASLTPYRLDGLWKSDWDLTKNHVETECRLDPKTIALLERLMGKMTVRYEADLVICSMPEERRTDKDGRETVLPAWETREKFIVLGRVGNQIAVRDESADFGDSLYVVTFDDADTYWIYVGHSPVTSLHVREYFRRLQSA